MTNSQIKNYLEENQMDEVLEIIKEAEAGELEELELVESLGLLQDKKLNEEVLQLLQSEGVNIIYISAEE
ncbi:hypothetical protein [Alteribacillus sp. HJP-4]|uniref:hypothetical protein n=1 Tax=Alteribacillus sp. HJP-4 TaxID=2775394 RepID=UPI0035CD3CF0